MKRIIAASRNAHKIEEIEQITKKYGMNVVSRDDAGLPKDEVEEDGETFEENSYKKAKAIWDMCHETVIADDSGLMVDALDGAPGVYSARFAGEEGNYKKNNDKLIECLKGLPEEKRSAKFVTVITLIYPDGKTLVAKGQCPGRILESPRGQGGFGYDPLFMPEGFDVSFAEMTSEEKNTISHRAMALKELERMLSEDEERKG